MNSKLEHFRNELESNGIAAQIRGSGAAQFVFATKNRRAIELSNAGEQWWVEFWEADDDEEAPPVNQSFFDLDAEAITAMLDWLCRDRRTK